MIFGAFLENVDAEVVVFRPDGKDYNVIINKDLNINLDWAESHKDRFVKYICRVDAYNVLTYDVELYPEGAPEGEVRIEEYVRQGALLW